MSSVVYNSAKKNFGNGTLNWTSGTYKIMLVTSSYVADIDAHSTRADVTNEVTGTGYTAGGQALTTLTDTQDNTNDRASYDADDVSWGSSTITARGAVIYKSNGGGASGDPLVCYLDFGSNVSSTSNTFTVQFATAGVVTLT